jgi:nucleotide-binding universal stress UspA family protein
MRLLIGYDGSPSVQQAIADLRRAGLPPHGTALVVSVADVLPPAPSPSEVPGTPAREKAKQVALAALAEAQALGDKGVALATEALPGWSVSGEALAGSSFWGLVQRAEELRTDLILVGTHGKSPLERLVLGSVSQTVVRHAPCSVRIGRASLRKEGEPARLIVGVDGSQGSAAAVTALAERRWTAGSEVAAVAVVDPPIRSVPAAQPDGFVMQWVRQGDGTPEAWIKRALDAVTADLAAAGLRVQAILREGDPKRVLIELAESMAADCIFVGARGLTRVERLLLGSVSAAVAARAGCSVEVVRGARE